MIDLNNEINIDDNNDENQINDSEKIDSNNDSKRTNKRKQTFERKNIRNIIDDEKFGKDAKEAQKAEFERLKRVQEKEQNTKLQNLLNDDLRISPNHIFQLSNINKPSYPNNFVKIFPSLPRPQAPLLLPGGRYKRNNCAKQYRVVPDNCVIYLDDSDEEREKKQPENKVEVIEISDGEDDDDNFDDAIDQEQADINNIGRDENGNILINIAHSNDEDDFFLSQKIAKYIKPHQVSGIRFLYENLIESKKQFKEADGFGCILAHSMGLGKTIQIIGFLDILFRCCQAKSALVIVPINTIQNWQAEIEYWLPTNEVVEDSFEQIKMEPQQRSFNLFVIKDCHKTIESRHNVIKEWMTTNGVLLIGYEMFRLLVTYRQNKTCKSKRKDKEPLQTQPKRKIFIDVELEEKRNSIYGDFLKALVNPGPEVVICDEGHRIKNSEASISKALKAVRTHRRVVMTGYPLQNNLTEYWCMVDFVRPNYLGSKHEFNNMFQRPIENGQCVDSTIEDRKLMQGRAHVLHELLQGFVQRRSHAVLKANLPPKWEYVIMIRMSQIQRKLYSGFMEQLFNGNLYNWSQNSTLKIYAMCCKIWNHPDILFRVLKEKMLSCSDPDFDFDIEDDPNMATKNNSSRARTKAKESLRPNQSIVGASSTTQVEVQEEEIADGCDTNSGSGHHHLSARRQLKDGDLFRPSPSSSLSLSSSRVPSSQMSYSAYLEMLTRRPRDDGSSPYSWLNDDSWTFENGQQYVAGCEENSGKVVVFLSLLEDCLCYGDKMLVFSQSLLTLDIIELFLKQTKLPDNSFWEKNKTYFRLDGSTSASERERMINSFNEPNSAAQLFLLSTRAGCLGINLIGANRVVVFDASWNPCHDCQAVCRVYRYGQIKPCFIYRLVTDNTMEKKIYDRQITKQGISDRVVDESNPGQHFLRSQVQVLIDYEDKDLTGLSEGHVAEIRRGCGEEDPILGRVLEQHAGWVTKLPFTHESLLIDRKDYRLTKREKRKAKESYERDKRQSLYYQKNSYSDYYIKTSVPTAITNMSSSSNNNNNNNNNNGYVPTPQRTPVTPYRSSIMSNQPNSSSLTANFSGNYNNHFKQNRNIIRPQVVPKSNSALMREIEEARLRCGFSADTAPYPIAVSEDEEDVVVVRKKSRNNNNQESTYSKSPRQMVPTPSENSETSVGQKQQSISKPQPENDSSNEVPMDKAFKVIKIIATTELNFPAVPSIVTSQASSTKICSGEPLEIIYTSKGKFLRVPRTGDLFAIKDNKERKNPNSENFLKISENLDTRSINNNSLQETPQILNSSKNYQNQKVESISSTDDNSLNLQSEYPVQETAQCFPSGGGGASLPVPHSLDSSTSYNNSPNINGSHKEALFSPQLCCQCKFNQTGLNFIIGCNCFCHLPSSNTVQSPIIFSSVPSSHLTNNQHIFFNPLQKHQQQQQQQAQFVVNNISGGAFAAPFFYSDQGLISVISTPLVNSQNNNQWQQSSHFQEEFPNGNTVVSLPLSSVDNSQSKSSSAVVNSSFNFSDL